MKLKKIWKYLGASIAILCIGVLIGIVIGMPIGETKGRSAAEEAYERMEQDKPDVTEGAMPTPTPEDEQPSNAPEGETTLTKAPEGEIIPTEGANPTNAPAEGTTSTPEATAAPDATDAPDPTETPEPSDAPETTSIPEATATPKPTAKPTSSAKPTEIPTAKGENGYYGRLHVEGTYLADKDDKLVQLRGVSTHGLGWFPQYVNEAAIRQFNEEWGCNVFRLAMYTAEGAGYCTNGDDQKEKLKALVHKGVEAAIEEDMYVIIDWHVLHPHSSLN